DDAELRGRAHLDRVGLGDAEAAEQAGLQGDDGVLLEKVDELARLRREDVLELDAGPVDRQLLARFGRARAVQEAPDDVSVEPDRARAVAQAQRQPALRRQAGVGLDRQAREADVEHRAVERDDQAAVAVRQADALVATTIRLVAHAAPPTAVEQLYDASYQ